MAYCWAGVCSRKTAVGVDYSLKFGVLTFLDESLLEVQNKCGTEEGVGLVNVSNSSYF